MCIPWNGAYHPRAGEGNRPIKTTPDCQRAAAGAIIYPKLLPEGTNRVIPRKWSASEQLWHRLSAARTDPFGGIANILGFLVWTRPDEDSDNLIRWAWHRLQQRCF